MPLLYATGAFALALTGPGGFSLDAVLGLQPLGGARIEVVALVLGIVGGMANLAVRRPPQTRRAQ